MKSPTPTTPSAAAAAPGSETTNTPQSPGQLPITGLKKAIGLSATPTTGLTSQGVPVFSHVILIMLENHGYNQVVGNRSMPNFNQWIKQYTLLTQDYAITHPSLPNYLALVGGSTFGISSDCGNCFINQPNIATLIEDKQGLSWKTYQEGIPSPCFVGFVRNYSLNHDPFVYFNAIRDNKQACDDHVVPFSQLQSDLQSGNFPNFAFISPNLCDSAHNCSLATADKWIGNTVNLLKNSKIYDQNTLIIITFDEGNGSASCCGLGRSAGGRVATLLISPLVKQGFADSTEYSHYSILKTISTAWGLKLLGHAADPTTSLIVAPWKTTK